MKIFNKNLFVVSAIVFVLSFISPTLVLAAATVPPLGVAASFSVLAGLSMSSTPNNTHVSGNLGLSPGFEVSKTGIWIVGGNEYFGDSVNPLATTAQTAALGAWNNLATQPTSGTWGTSPWSPVPGVWTDTSSPTFTGTITLNGGYDDVWVFQVSTDFTFSGSVVLSGNAQACHVFWQIAQDATIASGSTFVGTLIAGRNVSFASGATVNGRIFTDVDGSLAMNGTSSTISGPTCVAAPATLHVIKHVIIDNGGTADASDFTMNVTGTNVSDPSFDGAESGTTITLDAGAYSVDENAFSGYTKSLGTNCSGTITAGETKNCTVTNDDIAPSLTLDKIVVNDNGGTALESAWTLTATGPTTLSGAGATGSADVVSGVSFEQGTYTLSESPDLSGYTASTWSCTSGIAVNGSSQITLGLGQSTVCTITNDDIAQAVSNEERADIKVTKEASKKNLTSGPDKVTFTYRVTNKGDVALSNISVKDDKCDSVDYASGDSNSDGLLDTSETWVYRCEKTVKKTETNTVTAKGTANGVEVKDTDTAKVTVSTPGLPNVGVGSVDEENNFWSNIVRQLSSLFASRE